MNQVRDRELVAPLRKVADVPPARHGVARLALRVGAWQVALLAVVWSAVQPSLPRIAVALGCLVLATPTALRRHGRWLDEWMGMRRRYRRRAHRRATAPLDALVAGLRTESYTDRSGRRLGLLRDGTGWVGMLRLEQQPGQRIETRTADILNVLARVLTRGAVRPVAAQLVTWAVPTPGSDSRAAFRFFWVAVRFDPTVDPQSTDVRGGGDDGARRATATVLQRVALTLRQLGFGVHIVAEPELLSELSASLGLGKTRTDGTAQTPRQPTPVERWGSWSVGALHHACYRLPRVPSRPESLAGIVSWVADPPALTTCVSVLLHPDGQRFPHSRAVVRFAVPAERDERSVRAALRRAGAGIRHHASAMNGEQHLGVRATLPLADRPAD
jgi:type VII secretion protein EccE